MNQQPSRPKVGQGVLAAAGRQGLRELGKALQPLPDSMPIVEEPGQIGTATQQAVSQQTGVTQDVRFNDPQTPSGFAAVNPTEPDVAADVTQPEIVTPGMAPDDGMLDQLLANAQEMSQMQEPEMEIEQ